MKTKLITMSALVALGLSSCGKDDTNPNTSSKLAGTATIKGIVKADTDITNATSELKSGAIILAKYNQADLILNPQPGVTYPDVVLQATTNSLGEYSFTIPTAGQAVNVEIIPQDFIQDVITGMGTSNSDVQFSTGTSNHSVIEKEVKLYDINY